MLGQHGPYPSGRCVHFHHKRDLRVGVTEDEAVLKASLSSEKDVWNSGFQDRDLSLLRSMEVRDAVRRLKLLMKRL